MMTTNRLSDPVKWLLSGRDDSAAGRCGCTGQCGHRNPWGRCDDDKSAGLTVAPADQSIPVTRATTLPTEQLIAWCPSCRRPAEADARRRQREQLNADAASRHLALWGGASCARPRRLRGGWPAFVSRPGRCRRGKPSGATARVNARTPIRPAKTLWT